ncbi:phage tail tape measure protein [Echinicola strongylocentroti]|uniref:Phage tail tape measure protein n=1 Tax=Echinicola strongylocentroti TaxID=1795355 RepID=A0A2Z4IMI2_9BACT|nr:phage tail tape measure protein [Echinicola strongylocentroti]AWW31818.1 phage tail tape measure protein [Echinicola strongylocentroti]
MAKVKEDISRVRLQVDGKQGINELGKLEMEAKELQIDMKNAKKGTDEYVRANKKLADVRKQIRGLREELGLSGMTLGQLTRYQRELRNEIRHTTTSGTKDYKRLKAELRDVNKEIRNQNAELRGSKGFFSGIKKELMSFGVIALSALGATEIFSQFQSMIDGSARLSDALADVQKTTNLTDEELEKLSKTLKTFNTRTPRRELLGLAEIAGRLGITSRKDIEGFVRAADKINVSLGDALGDPEKVMRELGKLTDTYDIKAALGIEDSLLKVGSAINDLGMASTANEGYLVEFSKRMGGVAPLAKITIQDILGLGATLDSLGQTSEVSSTALSKLFLDMAKNAKQYAKYAKLEVTEFVELMNNDANEAFLRVLEGVKGNSDGITQLASTMVDLEQDGGRVVGVLGTLANNTEKLRQQQDIANSSFEKGTSVIDEFNTKNNNFAANLEKVQKWLAGMFVNSAIMDGLNRFVSKWAEWIEIPVSETMQAERTEMMQLYTQIITTNEGMEERRKLINKLIENHPQHLGNLNAEKISNNELANAIARANEEMINSIALKIKEEEIIDQSEEVADKLIQKTDTERRVREQMVAIAEKYNLELKEGNNLIETATNLANEAGKQSSVWDFLNPGTSDSRGLIDEIAKLKVETNSYNESLEENKALMDAKNQLAKDLGINLKNSISDETIDKWEEFQDKISNNPLSTGTDIGKENELIAVNKKYDLLEKELKEHLDNQIATHKQYEDTLAELQSMRTTEVKAVNAKYKDDRDPDKKGNDTGLPIDPDKALAELEKLEKQWLAYQEKIRQIRQEYQMAGMDEENQEIIRTQQKYDTLQAELKSFYDQGTISLKEYVDESVQLELEKEQRLDLIRSTYIDKAEQDRQEAATKVLEALGKEKELAILQTNNRFQKLLDMADEHGFDKAEIIEKWEKEIQKIEKEYGDASVEGERTNAEARIEIARGMSQALGGAIDFIGNKSGELTKFQKVLTAAQIGIDLAASLSSVVPKVIAGSGGNPLVFASYLATMTGAILAAIGKAKSALSSTSVPEWKGGTEKEKETPQRPQGNRRSSSTVTSFYSGGDTGRSGMGIGDRYGEFTGYVHKDEYVVPSFIRSHPYVADVLPAIEAIRQEKTRGFYKGGESNGTKTPITPINNSDPEMLTLLKSIDSKLDNLPTSIKAYLVDSELEEFRNKRQKLKDKYIK